MENQVVERDYVHEHNLIQGAAAAMPNAETPHGSNVKAIHSERIGMELKIGALFTFITNIWHIWAPNVVTKVALTLLHPFAIGAIIVRFFLVPWLMSMKDASFQSAEAYTTETYEEIVDAVVRRYAAIVDSREIKEESLSAIEMRERLAPGPELGFFSDTRDVLTLLRRARKPWLPRLLPEWFIELRRQSFRKNFRGTGGSLVVDDGNPASTYFLARADRVLAPSPTIYLGLEARNVFFFFLGWWLEAIESSVVQTGDTHWHYIELRHVNNPPTHTIRYKITLQPGWQVGYKRVQENDHMCLVRLVSN